MKTKFYYLMMCIGLLLSTTVLVSCGSDDDEAHSTFSGYWIATEAFKRVDWNAQRWDTSYADENWNLISEVSYETTGFHFINANTVGVFRCCGALTKSSDAFMKFTVTSPIISSS